jgi:four helix bundle protein
MSLKSYRDLEVWQKAMDLVEEVYRIAGRFPSQEKYGLTGQLQRAAVSIPANIAEGYARMHRKEYLQHLSIARGSLAEVETHLAIAVRLGFASKDDVIGTWNRAQDVGKLLTRLIQSLGRSQTRDPNP